MQVTCVQETSTLRTDRASEGASGVSSVKLSSLWPTASTRSPSSRKRITTLRPSAPPAPVIRTLPFMLSPEWWVTTRSTPPSRRDTAERLADYHGWRIHGIERP